MPLHALNHFTITPVDLDATKDFYSGVLGLDVGYRPPLNFPGYWLYSAGAATVEGRQARMKLPVRFGRILYLGTPGAAARVSAKVQDFADDFIEGDIEIYDHAGKPCGPRDRSRRDPRRDLSRRLGTHA